jgi:hypothetical protein
LRDDVGAIVKLNGAGEREMILNSSAGRRCGTERFPALLFF